MTKEEAIAAVEESRATHIAWLDYIRDFPEEARKPAVTTSVAGDSDHHKRCVAKYDGVIAYLKGT